MANMLSTVKNCELFKELSDCVIQEQILPYGFLQVYQKGQFLIMPQQRMDHLGLILSGKVQILHIPHATTKGSHATTKDLACHN